jgi:hypothetical protein
MKRLDTKTLPCFLDTSGVAVILVGSEEGLATFEQAGEFALLWADHAADHIIGARFGYIDGAQNPEALTRFKVAELPATLIVRNGLVTHRFYGRCSRHTIAQALRNPLAGARRPYVGATAIARYDYRDAA